MHSFEKKSWLHIALCALSLLAACASDPIGEEAPQPVGEPSQETAATGRLRVKFKQGEVPERIIETRSGLQTGSEPLDRAIAALGAGILFAVAKRGRVINTGKVLRGAPWQIVIFSLGMYLVVYGLRNAGLTDYLTTVLNMLAERGLWAATLGTGILSAFLSSIMNNMPSVLVGALSIDGSAATGTIKEAMIYANVIGCDLGPKITPIGSLATLLWLHVLAQKHITIGWGYYFRCGITMTLPVLLVTLAALALRLSFNQP